jgi:Protein of unknown function/Domain of unknown function (DUF1835)
MVADLLHIVLGDSAAGSLREACSTLGVPGKVFAIPDELSHGPLHDGRARASYFRDRIYGRITDAGMPDDVFAPWQELVRLVKDERPSTVVIWSSDAISDLIFLRMACWWLRDFDGTIASVNTSEGNWHGVGINSPEQLRALYSKGGALSMPDRRALAREFEEMRDRHDLLRVYHDGKIISVDVDYFDAFVASFATTEWRRAVQIVGECMGHGSPHNMIGDAFLEWRLQHLIDSGQLEAEGDRSNLRAYRVRLGMA